MLTRKRNSKVIVIVLCKIFFQIPRVLSIRAIITKKKMRKPTVCSETSMSIFFFQKTYLLCNKWIMYYQTNCHVYHWIYTMDTIFVFLLKNGKSTEKKNSKRFIFFCFSHFVSILNDRYMQRWLSISTVLFSHFRFAWFRFFSNFSSFFSFSASCFIHFCDGFAIRPLWHKSKKYAITSTVEHMYVNFYRYAFCHWKYRCDC